MKEKFIFLIIFFFFGADFPIVNCIYRNEAFDIFDKYILIDLFERYKKQIMNKACSIKEGSDCFQLSRNEDILYSNYFQKIIHKLKKNETQITTDSILKLLKQELKKFQSKTKATAKETFTFTPKIMMNLLMNFESYDEFTKVKDIKMPSEKIVKFNIGYLKLNFKGNLRLTSDRGNDSKTSTDKNQAPAGTYGIVENGDLYIRFDKPVTINYIYARPHLIAIDMNTNIRFKMTWYRKERMVYQSNVPMMHNKQWHKITYSNLLIDILRIPNGFEIDDISISYDSNNSDKSEDNSQLTSILKKIIDELVDNSNKNQADDL